MKLIVGLGNPGAQFRDTRHNLGFMVLEHLQRSRQYRPFHHHAELEGPAELTHDPNRKAVLARPLTMMNRSGTAIRQLLEYHHLMPHDLWVVHDELDLPFGTLRSTMGGSSAGHQGVESIIAAVGPDFGRMRLGINPLIGKRGTEEKFVLEPFSAAERVRLPKLVGQASSIIGQYLDNGQLPTQTIKLI